MTPFVFLPSAGGQTIIWTNASLWNTGTVPNSAQDAVYFPPILQGQSSQVYSFTIDLPPAQSFTVGSLEVGADTFDVEGNLSVTNSFALDAGAQLYMQGGTLTAGSWLIASGASISGELDGAPNGSLVGTGLFLNHGTISNGDAQTLKISSASFLNDGTISVDDAGTVISISATGAGGGLNRVGSTLVGGSYSLADGATIDLSIGGTVTSLAASVSLSSGAGLSAPGGTIAFFDPASNSYVSLQSSLTTIAPTGLLSLTTTIFNTSNALTVEGQLEIKAGAQLTSGSLTVAQGGTVIGLGGSVTGSGGITNDGSIVSGLGGAFEGQSGSLTVNGDITGTGTVRIGGETYSGREDSRSSIELTGAVGSSQTVVFTDGTGSLSLDQPQKFAGSLNFGGSGDEIILDGISLAAVTGLTYANNTLTFQANETSFAFKIVGDYGLGDFSLSAGPQQLVTSPASVILGFGVPSAFSTLSMLNGELVFAENVLTAPVQIVDFAANLSLDELQSMAAAGKLASVSVIGTGGLIVATPQQLTSDAVVFPYFTGAYSLSLNGVTVAQALSDAGQSHIGGFAISDSTANIDANIDALQGLLNEGLQLTIARSDATSASVTVSETQWRIDQAALQTMTLAAGAYGVTIIAASAADAFGLASQTNVTLVSVLDSAADVAASLDALEALAKVDLLGSITLTESGTAMLDLTSAQQSADQAALAKIAGSYSISTISQSSTTLSAAAAVGAYQGDALSVPVTVSDSAADIATQLDGLALMAANGQLTAIQVTGASVLSVTAQQTIADGAALALLPDSVQITLSAGNSSIVAAGVAGHGNLVSLSGDTAQYTVTPAGDGVSFTISGQGATDSLSAVQALQFADTTEIVAAQPGTRTVTSGNIAELYGAVFAREPDLQGLSYYETVMQANPALPITVYAEWFLQSPEYTGKSAHAYVQTPAGDTQFITDTYQNLLSRPPDSGGLAFYQALVARIIGSATPGSAAYGAAELLAHATVLADFSASPEFLSDVQVTSTQTVASHHWLILI